MKLILASSNKHKADELKDFFKETQIEIESAPEKLEVIEDGKSFEENAFKKAVGQLPVHEKKTYSGGVMKNAHYLRCVKIPPEMSLLFL